MENKILARDEAAKLAKEIKDLENQLLKRKERFQEVQQLLSKQAFEKALKDFVSEFGLGSVDDVTEIAEIVRNARAGRTYEKPVQADVPKDEAPVPAVKDEKHSEDIIADEEIPASTEVLFDEPTADIEDLTEDTPVEDADEPSEETVSGPASDEEEDDNAIAESDDEADDETDDEDESEPEADDDNLSDDTDNDETEEDEAFDWKSFDNLW